MIPKRVSCCLLVLGLGVAAGCSHENTGTVVNPDIVAGLRYVNLVPDTTGLDFRVIDVVANAPNTIGATFRTSGSPFGVTITGFPMHNPVLAGKRHIRAFLSGTSPAVASIVIAEDSATFDPNTNYTVYLYGYANPVNGTPSVKMLVVKDSVQNIANGKWALRVLNLAPTYTGTSVTPVPAAGSGVDVRVHLSTAASGSGTALIANTAFGGLSAYNTTLDTSSIVATAANFPPWRLYVTANTATAPAMLQAIIPQGARGTALVQPVPGTLDSGTAITAIIVPRSTVGTGAPQATPASVSTQIDSVLRSNDTVTVVRTLIAGNGTTTCTTASAVGVAANDILTVSGLTQPEYNGGQVVLSVTAGTNQTVIPASPGPPPVPFSCTGTAVRARFRYRISGTPVSPATGAMSFKINSANSDFLAPTVLFIFDRVPARTAP